MAWLPLLALLQDCATDHVPPIGDQGKPFRAESDERALLSEAEKEEVELAKTTEIYGDPRLEEYLGRIAAKLQPRAVEDAGAPAIRVTVLRDPALGAFAMPDGRAYIYTGLLARLENEAQLAAVLGHELTHVIDRHALRFELRGERTAPARSDIFARLGLRLASVAAVTGYGRDLEREADRAGVERMSEAGYDPGEIPRMLERLEKDPDSGKPGTLFWGNRARLAERIASIRELIGRRSRSVETREVVRNTEEFAQQTRRAVRDNAALDVQAGRFVLARVELDRVLALAPGDPVTHLYRGELYRIEAQSPERVQDEGRLLVEARQEYERAAALDPASGEPFRQMGFLYYQNKDNDNAVRAFRKYLSLEPNAPDARRIEEYVVELER